MDAASDRKIIRLWNRLRLLEKEAARSPLCFGRLKARWLNENAMQLDYVRSEIERMRTQVHRQRGDIRQLQRVGISTASAEALLERMLNKIDELCAERDKLKKSQPRPTKGKVLGDVGGDRT
jgi:hypothetical protein